MKDQDDILGSYDEIELIGLSEADTATGGATSTIGCATISVASIASASFCPTTKCSSQC